MDCGSSLLVDIHLLCGVGGVHGETIEGKGGEV